MGTSNERLRPVFQRPRQHNDSRRVSDVLPPSPELVRRPPGHPRHRAPAFRAERRVLGSEDLEDGARVR